ncbi:sensor histidine kinase [Paenibacillus mucilaginosus]|uniref:Signal transduction histidine kinase, LytS n=1 Tax=Paenibacillus mucilaginosus (strain KNP414) TaxID=1036673 RepID=F8FQN6_PAEMK|nr:histidine kinase [Paenibacillus mucilaginosus]AEI40391.1 signal transduction histidine kinase, LytS [Paenibacillus mucilaginosus KNP414]MCG7213258.1 histidine kinase [Paenibacillus mucilaginosus]WDM29580.1 histidine kinase [Paenibacillus mucilaginosus]
MGRAVIRWLLGIRAFTFKLSLQAKLILSFVVVIFIPVVLFSWYTLNEDSAKAMKELMKNNENVLEVEKKNIENNIELMRWTAQLALSNREMNKYLQVAQTQDAADVLHIKKAVVNNFQYFLYNNPRIANVRLFTDNLYVNEIWPVILQESRIQDKPWHDEVVKQNGMPWWTIQGNVVLTGLPSEPLPNEPFMTYLQEFKYPDNATHNGILEISMRLSNFFSRTFSSVQDMNSQLIVVDRSGQVFSLKASPVFEQHSAEELMNSVKLTSNTDSETVQFEVDGQSYLAFQSYIPSVDVHLVNMVSLADTMKGINHSRVRYIVLFSLLAAFLVLLSYSMQAVILRRLKALRESMQQVRSGNFNVELPPITGTDEVGELGFHYRKLILKINELIQEQAARQAAGKEAELRALKNQIDSHFLYNTLENVKMLAEIEGQYLISDIMTSLGGMMRYSMEWNQDHVMLSDEIQQVQDYVSIMNIRYDGRLDLRLSIAPECLKQESLKMSLQPTVENAIKHGMRRMHSSDGNLVITISAVRREQACVIEITDSGCGIPEETLSLLNRMLRMEESAYQNARQLFVRKDNQDSNGIGLRNVDQRLVMSYGVEYGIGIESQEGSYTRVIMTLPYRVMGGGADIYD